MMLAEIDRFGGCSRDGESGELGEGDVDFDVTRRKAGPLDGDLDSDRRSCLNADAGSTWWMCVGDGKCRVPPASPCGEYDPTMRAFRWISGDMGVKRLASLTESLIRRSFKSEFGVEFWCLKDFGACSRCSQKSRGDAFQPQQIVLLEALLCVQTRWRRVHAETCSPLECPKGMRHSKPPPCESSQPITPSTPSSELA